MQVVRHDDSRMPPGVAAIFSQRLELVSICADAAAALIAHDFLKASQLLGVNVPPDATSDLDDLLRARLETMRSDPSVVPWLARVMVMRNAERTVVGHCGFHGPPRASGEVELGYTVNEPHRRRGYATEAVRALVDWAHREHGVTHFVASTTPDNVASLGVLRKLNFQKRSEHAGEVPFELFQP